jgi:hypothetical protein
MTSNHRPRPRTVAELVLDDQMGDSAEPPEVDDAAEPSDGLLHKLSTSGRAWVRRQALTKLESLLGENLADVLATAWARGGGIARAARETAGDPTAERLVLLHEQQSPTGTT